MPSLADQTEDQLGGPWSVLTRQRRDHVRLDSLLHELGRTSGTEQDAVLNRISRLVFPHAFAEEAVLWPQLRRVLPDGERLTLDVEQEHQEVNELFVRLEARDVEQGERQRLLARLVDVLRTDVRDEEDVLLPRFQEAVGVRRLRLLGLAWEAVRRTAPTRPHAVVARRPPGNVLAALPLSLLDRGRDLLEGASRRVPGLEVLLGAGGRALGRAAGRVEQAGLLRRGEDPSTRRR